MKSPFVFLMIFAASSSFAASTNSLPSGKLNCQETTKSDDANFSEMTVKFSGKTALVKAKLSPQRIQTVEQDIAGFQKVVDGIGFGGGVATDEEKAEAQKGIEFDHAFIKAGEAGITFKATLQPYVHQPQGGMIRYALDVTTPGVDAASLWDRLGNEGESGILRFNPDNLKDVEIYVSGGQGGVYDNFSCDQE